MIPLDPAGLEAAARQLAENERLAPNGERARDSAAEVVRAYLAAAGRAAATPDPPDAYTVCVEALAEWWTGQATAAEVTGWMNGALQAARLPELDRRAAISMCNMVMADLGDECDYGAVVSNVLRAAYPAASPDERLREADRRVILEWAKFTRDEAAGYWGRREEDVYQRLLAAADREKPDGPKEKP